MEQLLALFPLQTVLFPGVTISLHIFEPRYRLLINRCIQNKQPFGVVLIREGEEVASDETSEPAVPFEIGTTAVIQQVLRTEDGRMLLSAQGEQRFRILRIVEQEPYLVAQVEPLSEEVTPESVAAAEQVRALYERHRTAITAATGVQQDLADLSDDPISVSFDLSDRFRIVNFSKQQLLEAELDERLGAIAEAFSRELKLLPPVPREPPKTHDGNWTLN
jgi:uncharacterized protein